MHVLHATPAWVSATLCPTPVKNVWTPEGQIMKKKHNCDLYANNLHVEDASPNLTCRNSWLSYKPTHTHRNTVAVIFSACCFCLAGCSNFVYILFGNSIVWQLTLEQMECIKRFKGGGSAETGKSLFAWLDLKIFFFQAVTSYCICVFYSARTIIMDFYFCLQFHIIGLDDLPRTCWNSHSSVLNVFYIPITQPDVNAKGCTSNV